MCLVLHDGSVLLPHRIQPGFLDACPSPFFRVWCKGEWHFAGGASVTHANVSSPLRHRLSSVVSGRRPGRAAVPRFSSGTDVFSSGGQRGMLFARGPRLRLRVRMQFPPCHQSGSLPLGGLSVELGLGRSAGRRCRGGTPRLWRRGRAAAPFYGPSHLVY